MAAPDVSDEESQGMAQRPLSTVHTGSGSWPGCRAARVGEFICTGASPGTRDPVFSVPGVPSPAPLRLAQGCREVQAKLLLVWALFWGLVFEEQTGCPKIPCLFGLLSLG